MYVFVFLQPQPLAYLEEDIREVLKQETGADIFNRADVQPDYRAWKHSVCVACTLSSLLKYTSELNPSTYTKLHSSAQDGIRGFTVIYNLVF